MGLPCRVDLASLFASSVKRKSGDRSTASKGILPPRTTRPLTPMSSRPTLSLPRRRSIAGAVSFAPADGPFRFQKNLRKRLRSPGAASSSGRERERAARVTFIPDACSRTPSSGDFSYADIALFMAVLWVLRLSGPHLDTWPGLARWHARVGARNSVAVAAAEIAAADRELSPPIGHE